MTYAAIWEWIYNTYDINDYFIAEDLLYDVEQRFNNEGRYFPPEARALVKERFQYRRVYAEMQRLEDEQKKISEFIGSGNIPKSLSDEIMDDLNKPEIMGIDVSEYATTKESIIPPEIKKFATSQTFFGRISSGFKRLFRRK